MKKDRYMAELKEWSKTLIIAIIISLVISRGIIVNATVPTGSMKSTIEPGDRLIAYRLAYLHDEPERGDIVTFIQHEDDDKMYVKRLIGLPGDEIIIVKGQVYINGDLIEEPYLNENLDLKDYGPFTVPEDHYFFLGDNRTNSGDSRKWSNPYISESDLTGKVIFKYFPSIEVFDNNGENE